MTVIRPGDEFLNQPYWRHLASGRLHLNCCEDCGVARHPPAPICPRCRSFREGWKPASGLGRLNTFTEVRHPVHPLLADATPYVVTLVDLDEGVRMVSGLPPGRKAALRAGMRMRCEVVRFDDRFALPYFLPVEGADDR